jgi:hypothetical protein
MFLIYYACVDETIFAVSEDGPDDILHSSIRYTVRIDSLAQKINRLRN